MSRSDTLSMMRKLKMSAWLPTTVLGLSAVALFAFQNCSQVSFSDPGMAAKAAELKKACIDQDGVARKHLETWTVASQRTDVVTCPNAADSEQGYDVQTDYLCSENVVSQTGVQTTLVQPMANCPAPKLNASLSPSVVANNGTSTLTVESIAVKDVAYTCKSVATGAAFSQAMLAVGNATKKLSPIIEDLSCEVTAESDSGKITRNLDLVVDCESSGLLKDPRTRQCVEFSCKKFETLTAIKGTLIDVPARTAEGVCYTVKLMDAIPNSPSTLNASQDAEVVSARHGGVGGVWNPYTMNRAEVEFMMRSGGGARQVKLSSSASKAASILVDNFAVVGLAKQSIGLKSNDVYRSYGSNDSRVKDTHILLREQPLELKGFGPGGTSSIGSLDITTQVSTDEKYSLDVRALDCGGSRELSDIYLLFQ